MSEEGSFTSPCQKWGSYPCAHEKAVALTVQLRAERAYSGRIRLRFCLEFFHSAPDMRHDRTHCGDFCAKQQLNKGLKGFIKPSRYMYL